MRYVDSAAYGSDTFVLFLIDDFKRQGVYDLNKFSGAKKTEASRGNQSFIIEQRADMRGRLVAAAMTGNKWKAPGHLQHGAAALAGFAENGSGANTVDFDKLDEEGDFEKEEDFA